MLTTAACQAVNDAINGRDLECNDVAEDICVRLAGDTVRLWDPVAALEGGPILRVDVGPVDCGLIRDPPVPDAVQCWTVWAYADDSGETGDVGRAGVGRAYYRATDGRILDGGDEVFGADAR